MQQVSGGQTQPEADRYRIGFRGQAGAAIPEGAAAFLRHHAIQGQFGFGRMAEGAEAAQDAPHHMDAGTRLFGDGPLRIAQTAAQKHLAHQPLPFGRILLQAFPQHAGGKAQILVEEFQLMFTSRTLFERS